MVFLDGYNGIFNCFFLTVHRKILPFYLTVYKYTGINGLLQETLIIAKFHKMIIQLQHSDL